jgi:hypothetical protein
MKMFDLHEFPKLTLEILHRRGDTVEEGGSNKGGGAVRVCRSRKERWSTDRRTCFVPGEKPEKESNGRGQEEGGIDVWGFMSILMCLKTV